MSEPAKTGIFAALAALALGLAVVVVVANTPDIGGTVDDVGELFFEFEDPLAVTSMEIVKWNDETNEPDRFQVAQVDDVWSIPSHSNYPADAEDQLRDAATEVMGMTKLGVISDERSAHKLYGVLDPKDAKVGRTNVGTRVTLRDKNEKVLADFIIGDQVADQEEQRYVRVPNNDRTYTAKVSTDKLSTEFADWIEKDLLKLNDWDLRQVTLHNYSVDEARGALVNYDNKFQVLYDDSASGDEKSWTLVGQPDAGLDEEKLNDMRQALGDLKIVDVQRKPEGIGAGLTTEEGIEVTQRDAMSLQDHGFLLAQNPDDNRLQLFSDNGEIVALTKDGVEYTLRFGNVTGMGGSGESKAKPDAEDEAEAPAGEDAVAEESEESGESKPNRYLLVTAQFNPSAIEKPELEPLPGEAAGPSPEGETAAKDETPENATNSDEAPEAEKDEQDAGVTVDDLEKIEADGLKTAEESDETRKKEEAEREAERQRIERENKRMQEEYEEKLAEGREKAQELNDRFAKWYYVISDEEYQKIRLQRDAIVKAPEAPEEDPTDTDADESG